MKRFQWIKLAVLLVFMGQAVSIHAHAQAPAQTARARKQYQAPRRPRLIWDYQKELGLSTSQVARLKGIFKDNEESSNRLAAQARAAGSALESLLKNDGPLPDIKAKLQELANLQVEKQYDDIVATRDMRKTVTPAQLERWREIQEKMRPGK